MNARTKLILGIVIGFLVGFGVAWLVLNRPERAPEAIVETEPTEKEINEIAEALASPDDRSPIATPGVVEQELVEVKDQIAGEMVFISRVALREAGWVVVREGESGTALGNILGARRFDAGMYQGTVPLLRATETGATYYAELWHDNGDEQFDIETDAPVVPTVVMAFEAY